MSDELGGVWYLLNGATNGVAGDDLKVLLANSLQMAIWTVVVCPVL